MTPKECKGGMIMVLTLQDKLIETMIIYRKRNKLTQQNCADKIGISRSYYSDIENKKSKPSFDTLEKMNKVFNFFSY